MIQSFFQVGNTIKLGKDEYLIVEILPENRMRVESIHRNVKITKTLEYARPAVLDVKPRATPDSEDWPLESGALVQPSHIYIDNSPLDLYVKTVNVTWTRPNLICIIDCEHGLVLETVLLWELAENKDLLE